MHACHKLKHTHIHFKVCVRISASWLLAAAVAVAAFQETKFALRLPASECNMSCGSFMLLAANAFKCMYEMIYVLLKFQ